MTDYGIKVTTGENPMKLTSAAFKHDATIPSKYTCDGKNVSPPLRVWDVPSEARSLVLIVEDPDVPAAVLPARMWNHWVLFNIPPHIGSIPEGGSAGVRGKGSAKVGYSGPCPPPQYEPREHRYFFKLLALDIDLPLSEGATKQEVEAAMDGHVLAKAELMGRYART